MSHLGKSYLAERLVILGKYWIAIQNTSSMSMFFPRGPESWKIENRLGRLRFEYQLENSGESAWTQRFALFFSALIWFVLVAFVLCLLFVVEVSVSTGFSITTLFRFVFSHSPQNWISSLVTVFQGLE